MPFPSEKTLDERVAPTLHAGVWLGVFCSDGDVGCCASSHAELQVMASLSLRGKAQRIGSGGLSLERLVPQHFRMLWLRAQDLADRLPTDPRGFALLCNDLLFAFADCNGVDRSCLDFTDRINDPDGGIDGRCVGAPAASGRLIPTSNVMYQFKGGTNAKSASAVASEDILKKEKVRDGLREGSSFVYMAAWSKASGFEEEIVEELRATEAWKYCEQRQAVEHSLAQQPDRLP